MNPLNQFQILFFVSNIFTNYMYIYIFIGIFFYYLYIINNNIILGIFFQILGFIYINILELIKLNIKNYFKYFFNFIYFIFIFLFLGNILGIFPYSFVLTGQFIIIFFLSFIIFIGSSLLGINYFKFNFLRLFLPSNNLNISIILIFFLVPIEIISYFFRLISLSVRLFSNIVAGHALLKIILGIFFLVMDFFIFTYILLFIPLILFFFILICLELSISLIQALVFIILVSFYFSEIIDEYCGEIYNKKLYYLVL
jgi:ATP synthase subunit 6